MSIYVYNNKDENGDYLEGCPCKTCYQAKEPNICFCHFLMIFYEKNNIKPTIIADEKDWKGL